MTSNQESSRQLTSLLRDAIHVLDQWKVVRTLARRIEEVAAIEQPDILHAHSPALETQPAGTSCYLLSSQCDWFVDTS